MLKTAGAALPYQWQQSRVAWYEAAASGLKVLGRNWDGYDAPAVSPLVVEQLVAVLRQSLPSEGRVGSLVPGADGSVQAEWHLRNVSLGFVVDEDASMSAWVRTPAHEYERHGVAAIGLLTEMANTLLNV